MDKDDRGIFGGLCHICYITEQQERLQKRDMVCPQTQASSHEVTSPVA